MLLLFVCYLFVICLLKCLLFCLLLYLFVELVTLVFTDSYERKSVCCFACYFVC